MIKPAAEETVRVGLIGAGGVVRAGHLPSLQRLPGVEILAVADPAPGVAERVATDAGIPHAYLAAEPLLERDDLHAVVIATPNDEHPRLARAAAARGLHILSEKPLAVNLADAQSMLAAAEAAGVVHQTAFNYRFVPAIRWLASRVHAGEIGAPHHFRSQRFQDGGGFALGWRQQKERCGSGELADMMSHRIDFSHWIIGDVTGLFSRLVNLLPERAQRGGGPPQPSDVDDWASLLVRFDTGCTGVFEATSLAPGYGQGLQSWDSLEVNGSGGSLKYNMNEPTSLLYSAPGGQYAAQPVPPEFLTPPGAPWKTDEADPMTMFRWSQAWEFISAIREGRQAVPSFRDGVAVQRVLDAALRSNDERRWLDLTEPE